ncbi:MAG: SpoIIE family protein phosphatase [Acidobacteriota bacterium]|nr:SpoIIE family protein phosphatase [Acidobacteriota bacterium]
MEEAVKIPPKPLEVTDILTLLVRAGERLNTTLDMDELMQRIAETVKSIIDYDIFAILLISEKTQEMRIRFSVGHPEDSVRDLRIKVTEGIVGRAVETRRAVLVNDVRQESAYIQSVPAVRSELAVPLIFKNRVIGVMDLEAPHAGFFTEQHQNLLELVAGRIAVAIENARLYRRSVRQARTLQLLNEISRELSSVLVLNELLRKIAALTRRLINYDRFTILLADDSQRRFNAVITQKKDERIPDKVSVRFEQGIVGAAAAARRAVIVPDVAKDARALFADAEMKSELAVPLLYRDRVIGVADMVSAQTGYFTEDHARIFSTLAPQIAVAIENARLYERVVRSESRMERDLERAQEIQMHLMPSPTPSIPGLEVAVRFKPARELGGDLYDFFAYGKDRHVIAIGDVSGKGAPAALYGALAMGTLRSLAPQKLTPTEMLKKLNVLLLERKIEGHFITLTYGVWDPKSRVFRLANSGMPLPVLIRGRRVHPIRAEGVPLGLLDQAEFDETSVTIEKGDVLAMFSDGLLEAADPKREEFGSRRLETTLREQAHRQPSEIIQKVFEQIGRFEQGHPPRDDQTLLVMKAR